MQEEIKENRRIEVVREEMLRDEGAPTKRPHPIINTHTRVQLGESSNFPSLFTDKIYFFLFPFLPFLSFNRMKFFWNFEFR